MRMPFGKHKGKELEEIPESYLLWIYDHANFASPTLRREIARIIGVDYSDPNEVHGFGGQQRQQEKQQRVGLTTDDLDGWFRRLSRKFHPDRGGSNEAMKALLEGLEELKRMIKK